MIYNAQLWIDDGDIMIGWYGSEETEVGDWWDAVLCPDEPERREDAIIIAKEFLRDRDIIFCEDAQIDVQF